MKSLFTLYPSDSVPVKILTWPLFDKISSHSKNDLQLSRRRGISGFRPRVLSRALCAPIFLGPLTRQMGRCAPPHCSIADPTKIKNPGLNSDRQGAYFPLR